MQGLLVGLARTKIIIYLVNQPRYCIYRARSDLGMEWNVLIKNRPVFVHVISKINMFSTSQHKSDQTILNSGPREFTKVVYFKSMIYFQSMDWNKRKISVIQRVQ